MKRFLDAWSIKGKLGAAFGVVLLVLLAVSLAALRGAALTEANTRDVVDRLQPAVLAVMELQDRVHATAASLGFFLKSQEAAHKQHYQSDIQHLRETLERTRKALEALGDQNAISGFEPLAQQVDAFIGFEPRLLDLASSTAKNMPAMALADDKLNPRHMEILQAMGEMLTSEREAQEELRSELDKVVDAAVNELGMPSRSLASDFGTRLNGRMGVLAAIQDLRYSWGQVINGMRGFLAFREPALRDNTQLYLEQNATSLQRLQQAAAEDRLTFEQTDALERLAASRDEYVTALEEIFEVHGGDAAYRDVYLVRTEIAPLMDRLDAVAGGLVEQLHARIRSQSESLVDDAAATRNLVWTLLLAGMVIGLLIAWLISSAISRKLNAVVEAMKEIASGDGDLTRELHFPGHDEVARLACAFNRFLEKIRGTICEVRETSRRVATAAEHMAGVSRQAAAGTEQQREETTRAAQATTEMASAAHHVQQMAQAGAEAAAAAQASAHQGHSALATTQSQVTRLATDVEQAAAVIERLGQDSDRIGGVLDVIRGIAEQTNLLALNAAIEAARAGEQGRGFAVVADEVRSLASRTQESTEEIQGMIQSLQQAARQAVSVMVAGRGQVRDTVQHADETRQRIEEILQHIETINDTSGSIAKAARQQSDGVDAINTTMGAISDVAEQTNRGTSQLETSIAELAGVANDLQQLLRTFKMR